uniref:Uncharacterized protein n=1 Tax=Arundo donax TaxID=35708 RepID=A0A0A8Z0C6_ARUDO
MISRSYHDSLFMAMGSARPQQGFFLLLKYSTLSSQSKISWLSALEHLFYFIFFG